MFKCCTEFLFYVKVISSEVKPTEKQLALEKLEAENQSMKKKLLDLETLFRSSNNDKDQQLLEYHNEIERLRGAESTGSSKTQTDNDHERSGIKVSPVNLPALKEQLLAFIGQCQEFASNIDQAAAAPQEESSNVAKATATRQAVEVSQLY